MSSLTADFRHITILYSNDGEAWCNYILKHFQQPGLKLRVETLNLDTLPYEKPPELSVALQESYVTFVLMTAGLTDYVEAQSKWMSEVFYPQDADVNTIMVVPCHVDLDEIIDVCQKGNYKSSCWEIFEIETDGSNMSSVLERALSWVDRNKTNRNQKLDGYEEFLLSNGFCEVFPSKIQIGEKVAVAFTCDIEADVTMVINDREVVLEMINPYCAVCTIPDIPTGNHTVTVLVDGEIKAKSMLEHTPFTPNSLSALMEAFNVRRKEELDQLFAENFSQSVCNDPLLQKIEEASSQSIAKKRNSRYPSLIHWAAANGLKELCSQMMMSTAVISACSILNCDNENAADLARVNNHFELEEYINDFLETKLYVDACGLYVESQGLTSDYIYEDMGTPQPPPKPIKKPLSAIGRSFSEEIPPPPLKPRKRIGSDEHTSSEPFFPNLRALSKEINLSEAAVGCKSQNELIDLMEDFKKGDFTVGEVEMLFQSWKHRYNSGNAISFKEKQRQLEDFRTQNRRIFALKKTKQLNNPTIKEETAQLSISEPVIPRKPNIGPSSKRTKDARGSETKSTSSSVSNDSGVGSAQIDVDEITSEPVISQKPVNVPFPKRVRDFSAIDSLGKSSPGPDTTYMSMSLRGRTVDSKTDNMPKRKSCVETLKELEKQGEVRDKKTPPPLPPRKRKPRVFTKQMKH